MSVLLLREADVARLVDMSAAIDVVEEAFRRLASAEAMNVPRTRAKAQGIVLHSMSAAADYLNLVGWKNYTTTAEGARFHIALYDQTSGQMVALLEADLLGQLRTGATTGVAAEWLASPDAGEVGIFGTGRQARTQLLALRLARPIKRVYVYSRHEQRRSEFAARMTKELQIDVAAVDRPRQAVEDLPLVVTATSSREPVFDGNCLAEGSLLCAVGSNWLTRAEIDDTAVRLADNIVCDSVAACRHEAGDFSVAHEKGIFDWSRAVDLADVVSGRAVGRSRPESMVLFKSVGLAIEDVALAARVVELARAAGIGDELPL